MNMIMKRFLLPCLVLGLWVAPPVQPSAQANENDMMFTASVRPWGSSSFDFTLQNDSLERITGLTIEMDGGTNNYRFSFVYSGSLTRDARVLEPLYLQGNQGLVREVWNNIGGNELNNLINNARYPNSPDSRNILTGLFESPVNVADNYGQRIHGFLIPPISGNYTFWLAGDDQCQLYLSTSDNPASITPIATVVGWTGFREWFKYVAPFWPGFIGQRSNPVFLNANQPYYISVLQKEGGGADHVSVGWTLPNGGVQLPIPASNFRISTDNFAVDASDPSSGASQSETIRLLDIAGLTRGNTIGFSASITPPPANAAKVLWNNGMARQNAKITVFGEFGGRGELVIPDTLSNESGVTYTFQTDKRPRTLTVSSQVDGLGAYVSNYIVRVLNRQNNTVEAYTNPPGNRVINHLSDGMRVQIEAVGEVYLSTNGVFLYDSSNIPAQGQLDEPPRQRFVATGVSVNNNPMTGDPTQYSFDLDGDTDVKIRWRHDFALIVNHDFSATASPELDPNNQPWAGPLSSGAAGNPSPDTTKIHWFPKGEEVIAQIDGQVIDNSRPGLDIRYVPKVYHARGSARGDFREFDIHTNDFQIGQSPPQRLQVNSFVMDEWGSIDYIWQIQFGVRVNVDDPSRSALPRVFRVTPVSGQQVVIGSLEGTFWFDPGEEVKIASAANVTLDPNSLALSGWINGDGFYFGSLGTLATDTGALLAGGPVSVNDNPVAFWDPGFIDANGRMYHGLSIPVLRRPARVNWTYGQQVYQDTVRIGEYMFQQNQALLDAVPSLAALILREPDQIRLIEVTGQEKNVAQSEMAIWDPNALRLYPLVPGKFEAIWESSEGVSVSVIVTALVPAQPHYPHIANTPPVQLTPDPSGTFFFKALRYTEAEAAITEGSLFTSETPGLSVLLFGEIKQIGRGEPKEFLRVRVVQTKAWDDDIPAATTRIIGQPIQDPAVDRAGLGTGFLMFDQARYNPNVYDRSLLDGLAARNIYDMPRLRSTLAEKIVINRAALPGPIIPVNLHPGAQDNQRIVVVWYYDPTLTDEIMWPYSARRYVPRWPTNELEGLNRIVIASQFGSESVNAQGQDQLVAPSVTNFFPDGTGGLITSVVARATTYDPARIQEAIIYSQPNPDLPGYNPNEEHGLMAPSRRFAQVSPRPPAAFALRDNDLNRYNKNSQSESSQPDEYTSHPFVLVQYYDTALDDYRMRVYTIEKEDQTIPNYRFANQSMITVPSEQTQVDAEPLALVQEPFIRMEAGEPVIPFYPLGVVIGASPSPETFGINIKNQATYWEDHKGTSWAVSGGENAWFTFSIYYPMAPDFWWPSDKPGRFVFDPATSNRLARFPNVGDSVAFMPKSITSLLGASLNDVLAPAIISNAQPNRILYKSDWPAVAPILKAGETLTFPGGEYRADNPTTLVLDSSGNPQTVATPGLPGVLGFAVGEVVFDNLNPSGLESQLTNRWTTRMGQVLDVRTVNLPTGNFPTQLLPASGRSRVSGGKYVFNELPASLQKRFRYDPLAQSIDTNTGLTVSGRIEMLGYVNDKAIGDSTLTAPPPAVYVLEPNIMTLEDRDALLGLANDTDTDWRDAVNALYSLTRNPERLRNAQNQLISGQYLVGLQPKVLRNPVTGQPLLTPIEPGSDVLVPSTDPKVMESARQFGPGLALIPNGAFLDPLGTYRDPSGNTVPFPDVAWITVAENNDPSMGGSPVTLHVIKVDRNQRYRGAIKTVLSDNVFDENIVLRHTGDFGANADDLVFEWWYRADDGSLNVMPPYIVNRDSAGPWALFPDLSGNQGLGRTEVLLKGNPNAPETLLADSWWFTRYRHKNDLADDTDWYQEQLNGDDQVNFEWAGAGNNDPFNDFDLDGFPDYRAQLSMGWIKRVLDAVNPYEARIRDFTGDNPSTVSSMLQQLGPRFEGPVALNPAKDVIENVGLIELYETILKRASDLSINLSSPVSTPAIANALQLASTRLSDFYTLLGNEAYSDAKDPTIGIGSASIEFGSLPPTVFSFQNQLSSLIEEELGLLRGLDDFFARPVYNRLFWNFTKGEGEAAYVMNYNISDINLNGFIDEDDAMIFYPQGHGDAWGHYLTATRKQYDLLRHPFFNWVSRSEFYNLMDIVLKVDFLDERKFAKVAAAKARAGYDIVTVTYRDHYVEDPTAQWQGYTDVNPDRAWGVQDWARRAGQGAYFDWITANALLPSQHPNQTLEGIQKVDRESNADIRVVSANLNSIQRTFDDANQGLNPLRISSQAVPFDVSPDMIDDLVFGRSYFEQIYDRAVIALNNALAVWEYANESQNRIRQIAVTEDEFRNDVYQEDLAYRNALIEIFGRPYDGTVGPGRLYPAGYDGPDLALYMYVNVREINNQTVPGPTLQFATFDDAGNLNAGDIFTAYNGQAGRSITKLGESMRSNFAPTFVPDAGVTPALARDGWYAVDYTDLSDPKVPLDNFTQLMPVKASGYTFQAPSVWGSRPAVGELQVIINEMIQQEADLIAAIGAWDGLAGSIVRTMRSINSQLDVMQRIMLEKEIYTRIKYVTMNVLKGIQTAIDIAEDGSDTAINLAQATQEVIPKNLPTGGLAVSPGDALSAARGGVLLTGGSIATGITIAQQVSRAFLLAGEIAFDIVDAELELFEERLERRLAQEELILGLEDMVGDEPVLRVAIFKEIEALRALSERYRSTVAAGARLIDERAAFNTGVAAMTQMNRYQDMTFRVHRNHALQNYNSMFDIAARYTYLAAKAYDYETNLDPSDPASPSAMFAEIVRARTLGHIVDGEPQAGADSLAGVLGRLSVNYSALKSQLGFNNPQYETGKLSLRTEFFRILPGGETQPDSDPQFPGAGEDADTLWQQTLENARVENLWDIPEYRYYARPFASDIDANGNAAVEPGIVIRFGTTITAGQNVFGLPLSGGDHAYDPSVFATKVRSVGVWFSDYLSDDVLNDLPQAPRVYLIPVGMDIMSVANSPTPDVIRTWKVVDQQVPTPIPSLTSSLDQSRFTPLLDSLNGRIGSPRRYASFRAYHNAESEVDEDELVFDSRLIGRSVWNTEWMLIIPGLTLNSDPNEGLDRFIDQVTDINVIFQTYGHPGN